jgi:hypothetical protein
LDEKLKKLISDWAFRAGRAGLPVAFLETPQLPASLLSQITTLEPFRSRAIADAEIYWSMPLPFGFGMELFFPEAVEIAPFQNWPETVHEFTAEMEYCERMDLAECFRYEVKLERIGREGGEWRIIEVFSEAEREQMQRVFEITKDFSAKKEI